MLAPGMLLILGGSAAYAYSRLVRDFGFNKWWLLGYATAGALLVASRALFHWKATREERTSARSYWKTVIFLDISVFVLPVGMVLALDQCVGVYLRTVPASPLLVYPAHYQVNYRTSEFSFTAATNSIGIRNREVDLRSPDRFRILAIGDSFTYGWGVEAEYAWPRDLENRLSKKSRKFEVLNLGCPGTSVDAYATIAETAIPLLHPQLVVVAVLQGDDLKQLDLGPTTDRLLKINGVTGDSPNKPVAAQVVPHLFELRTRVALRRPRVVAPEEIQHEWQEQVRWMREHWNAEENRQFDALDSDIREMLLSGNLNPWDTYFAIKQPEYMAFTLHLDDPGVRAAIAEMATQLGRIKAAAAHYGAHVLVVSVPHACYTSPEGLATRRKLGYHLDDSALLDDAPDEAIRRACRSAGVDFSSFTRQFRSEAARRSLYFKYDGHFNDIGQALFAEHVADLIPVEPDPWR